MANIRCGKKWRMLYGGMPASVWLLPDLTAAAANDPVAGDLCNYVSGKPSAMATTPAGTTTENLTLRFICADGTDTDRFGLNAPGTTARTGRVPAMTQIGFQGSRVPDATSKTRAFIPITNGFCWVMTGATLLSGNTVPGTSYEIIRVGSGDYTIDTVSTQAVVTVLGIDEEDYLKNGTAANRWWVKAVTPGGYV